MDQRRLKDFPDLQRIPRNVILEVLRTRTHLFPHERKMSLPELSEATDLSETTVKKALGELAQWGEVYSPTPGDWVATDLD